MLKILLDLQRISIIKLVGEFRTVSAAFSNLRTLCLLLFCTLFCGQRQHEPAQQCWQPQLCSVPLSTFSFSPSRSPLLYSLTISAPALYKSRVSSVAQCVKGGEPFRGKAVEGGPLTLLIDAEYIIKPVTYVTSHCQQHIRHTPNQRSQLQFMDFPAH